MLTAERRQEILGRLERDGKVVASELVLSLGVSEDTVRRDLRDLAEQGLLQRVHGGALPAAQPTGSFARRLEISRAAKVALADGALPLLEGARVIVLDGGTSSLALARALPSGYDGTVVTNSPPIATALAAHPQVFAGLRRVAGIARVEMRFVRADVCVLGICSLHPEVGVTTLDHEEASVKRAMVASAGEVIALATADKLRTASPWVVSPLADVDHLVTDGDAELTHPFAEAGIDVVVA